MAEQQHLRRSKASHAGPPPHAHLALLALVGATALLLVASALTLISHGLLGNRHASFSERIVGPPVSSTTGAHSRVVTHHASSKTRVTIDRTGASITRHGHTVSLTTAGAGHATWQARSNGFLRRTPFGNEAIVDTGTRTELYLDVSSRVGIRTWRWHLGDVRATPRIDGSVSIGSGMVVRPPAIYDTHGKTVTPAGTHWTLDRRHGSTDLLLRLDDAHLSAPYTIDPEIDYGSGTSGTLYLKTAASTYNKGTNGSSPGMTDTLTTSSAGAICTGTTTAGATSCPGLTDTSSTNGTFYAAFVNNGPVSGLFSSTIPAAPTAGSPTGFMVDNPGHANGTVIPGGTWTFTVPTYTTGTNSSVVLHLEVGAWVVTDNGTGSVISSIASTLINPNVTTGSESTTDISGAPAVQSWSVANLPQVTLASNQHILVRFYLKKISSKNRSIGGQIYLGVNGTGTSLDGSTNIATPASVAFPSEPFETPNAPTSLTSGWVKAVAGAVGATYSTPGNGPADQGRTTFFLCTTNVDCSGGAPKWSGNSTSSVLTNGSAASATIGTALTNGTVYYLEGRNEATDPANANAPYATAVMSAVSGRTAVTADGVAPVDTITLTTPSGAFKSGSTIYYKGNAAGSFKLHDAPTDTAGSGVASSTFGLLSGGVGFSAHPSETILGTSSDSTAISWAAASGAPTIPVHATDAVGNSSADTTLSLTSDTSINTIGVVSVPATVKTLSVAISTPTVFADTGSGMASTSITRSSGQAPVANVCPASGYVGATVVSSPDVTVANGQCYVYTYTGTDNVGNTASAVSAPVLVDTTAPADAITVAAATGAYKNGTTVYYKGNAAGTFKIHDVVTDALSGPASATFGLLSGGAGFNAHSSETVAAPAGGPYDSTAITWPSGASGAPTIPVNGTDKAGNNAAATTLNLTLDNGLPTGGSISVPAYATSTSVTITSTNFGDGGSGIASNTITRSNGQAPVAGACPGSGYSGSVAVSSPDLTVANAQCYVYTLTATDNVGNVAAAVSSPVLVDTAAPSDVFTLSSVVGGVYKSGATIFYKGNAAGSFKLHDAVTDGVSGPGSTTFGLLSGMVGTSHSAETVSAPVGGPFDSTTISWAAASGTGSLAAHGNDKAGNSASDTSFTLTADNSIDTAGTISVPATVKTLSVTLTTSAFADSGSGLASTSLTRSNGQAPVANVCPASGYSGATVVSSPDTTVVNGQCYVYSSSATDNVGNTASVSSSPVLVDTTAPADAITITAVTGAFKSGATVYYKGNAAGTFKIRNAVTDALSGPASATFGALSGGAGFSTHNSETIGGSSPFDSTAISWTSASGSPTIAVNGTDVAGNASAPTTLTLSLDNGLPTGGSISVPAYATSTSVTITSTNFGDGGSGIASNTITRSNGQAPVAGACPGSGYSGSVAVSSPDLTVASGQCYVYALTATDNVGNVAAAVSSPVLVDTAAPSDTISLTAATGAFKNGTTIYYKGNAPGDFKLRDAVTDADSGPASATFGILAGGSGFSVHSSETVSGASPFDSTAISWTSASGAPTIAVNGTDAAGNNAVATPLTLSLDNGLPTGGSISVPAYATATSVAITSTNFGDGGSGIKSNTITRSNGQSPVAGVCPAAITFTGATVVSSPDAAVTDGQCYVYTLTGVDQVGNTVSIASSPVLVDATAPVDAYTLTAATGAFKSGTTIYYKGNVAGSLTLRNTVTDSGSGVASTTFGALAGIAGMTHNAQTVAGSSPYDSAAISWTSASGAGSLSAHSTDAAGNTSGGLTFALTLDNNAPTGGSISVPAYATSTPVTITSSDFGDAGSQLAAGANTITRSNAQSPVNGVCPGSGYSGATTVTSPDAGVANGQCYVYTLTATDNVGNVATAVSSPVLVDTTAPTDSVSLVGATGAFLSGTTIYYKGDAAGSFTLRDAVADGGSAPASATFGTLSGGAGFSVHNAETVSTPAGGPYDSTAISWAAASGGPTVTVHGADGAGNTSANATYTLASDTAAPSLAVSAPVANALYGGTTAYPAAWSGTTSDGGSNLASVKVSLKDPAGNYWNGTTFSGTGENLRPASFAAGAWTYDDSSNDAPSALSVNGTYTIHVVSTDRVGNAASSSFTFTYDNTAPAYASAALDAAGTHVDLTLTEAGTGLDTSAPTPASAFTISGATVSSLTYTDTTHIRLTLQSRLYGDATPTVTYAPGGLTTAQKVKDLAGSLLGAVAAQSVSMTAVPSLTQSTVTAGSGSIVADGSSTTAITVRLKNSAGTSLVTGGGTIALAVGAGTLGPVTNNGDGTYGAQLTSSSAAQDVTVSAQLDGSSLSSSAPVTFAPGAAASLVYGVQPPASVTAGDAVAPSLTVRVVDAHGNLVASGASITVALGTNPGGSSLSGTKTRAATAGIATFDDLSLDKTGTGYTLAASSGSLAGATSNGFTVAPAAAATMALAGGDNQSATVDTNVGTAPSVLITDTYGNPVSGVGVTFATSDGSLTGASATTDSSGVATVGSWRLATAAGANALTATSGSLSGSPVTFHATGAAGSAASIAVAGGNNQSATVDTNVGTAPSARVGDAFGNPVAGVAVTFAVASGGGSVTGANATTDGSGVATVGSWKLGTGAGANSLTASASGAGTATFSATGAAGTAGVLSISSGEGQSATVDTAVSTAPAVVVTDAHGNPVSGATVTFSVGSGGGSVTGGSTSTDAAGVATLGSWTLGTGAGANTLTVTSPGVTSLTFHASGTADVASAIAVGAGDNQSATVNTAVAVLPAVVVTDSFGNPVSGVPVTFAVASGGGSGTALSGSTGSDGRVSAGSWTLGTATGANTLTATASVGTVTFTATGTADSIDHLVVSPASASISADTGSQAYTAEGRDQYENSLGDVTGSTTFTMSGGFCVAATCTSTTTGTHTVTGTMLGASGTASLTVTAGAATAVSAAAGDNQTATANTTVATAPSVRVVDQYGNDVGGVAVAFAPASGGGSVTAGSATTDSSGEASVGSWTLGTAAGANTLTATTAVGVVTFNATAVADSAVTVTRSAGEGQTATVGTSVATPPSVLVRDQYGNPVAGVAVTFSGGSVTGGSATTASDGVATVGSWTLDTSAGANTLTATAAAGSVDFHATGTNDDATTIAVAGGDNQSATVGVNVGVAPSILVTDQYGNPVAGVAVDFAGGTVTGANATTGADGIASVGSWQLGTAAGAYTLSATSSGLGGSPLTFHATGTADAAATIAVAGGDNQSATVDTDLGTAPSVRVTDQYGNAVAGATVTFAVASGGGSATGLVQTTDTSGLAAVGSWQLGAGVGANTLTATSGALGGSPLTFHATGVAGAAGSLTIDSGEGQTATVAGTLGTALSVLVSDTHGNPVAGVSVTFAVASGGGAVTGGSATTGADGVATAGSWTLGTGAGANTLTASSAGLSSVTFHAIGTADSATTIAVAAGDNQSATVDTALATAPAVLVSDQYGNPVQGVAVTFAVASGNGSATGLTQSTGADGVAAVGSWTLGTGAGANTLSASSSAGSLAFNATGLADAAGSMTVAAGEGESATVNATVDTAPSVLVTDAHGNPVAGVSVTFTVATGGGALTGANRVTGADGLATVGSWQLGTTAGAGSNTLSVTATGLPSVTFHATALADVAANIDIDAGDSQSATVDNLVATHPSVVATDAYGNPVSGVAVTFAIGSGGGSGTGFARITGSDGVATVGSWRLGTTSGANTMTATASSGSVTFTATGTPDTASAVAVSAGDNQSATANTAVATAPAALVTDQYGNGVGGVQVTFAVATGGGSATGLVQTTSPSGVATVGSWTLGTSAGANALAATTSVGSVTFHATAAADSAASIAVASGDNQSAPVDNNVTAPSVRVSDQYGNPVAGVSVTFAVASGAGTATGLTQSTGADGVATVGSWKLGTTAGANSLSATSSVGSVTFNATAVAGGAGSIAVSTGEGQSATVGTAVAVAPAVLVADQFGNPVPGVAVTFSGGTVTGANATTGSDGVATVGSWTLGTTAGASTLTATSSAGSVTFHATGLADTAATLAVNGGDNQTATVDTDVSAPPSVIAADQYGNPVAGVAVTFGGGTVTGASASTGADGVATVGSWRLGTTAGPNTLTATASTGSVTFHATGVADVAGAMSVHGGDGQSETVNTSVATAPSVLVTDTHGNPVLGASVVFAVASGGGSVTGASASTDASGVATVGSWKLGTGTGANTLSVTSAGLPSVTIHATGNAGAAASLALQAGDNQSAIVHANVGVAPAVLVTDAFGNPVAGVAVAFAVASGAGSLTGASATTDGSGIAAAGAWRLGDLAGANTVTATSGSLAGSPLTFHATGTPDNLDHLALSPSSSSVTAGASQSYSAEGRDRYDNSLGDVTSSTTFGVAGGSCIASVCTATSAGSHAVTASMVGATGAATLDVAAGAATSVTANGGDNQTTTVDTPVTAPSVLVTDAYGNPVSGLAITFAIASGGGSVTGAGTTTGADGIATAGSWTLGKTAGANTLTATTSAGSVTFHATGTSGAATTIALNGGESQTATVATSVSTPPSAFVSDTWGNPVAGVAVTFAVSSGAGSITGAAASTGSDGVATVGSWTLGASAGPNTLTADSPGLPAGPVTFHATGAPESAGSLAADGGEGQSATVSSTLGTAPSVHATDTHGNPVPGLTVTFNVGSGNGTITGATQVTDASGVATVGSWTLGTGAGANTLVVSAANFISTTIHATGTADAAASIAVAAGEGQSATAGSAVATAPSVRVSDQHGNPVAGVAITFSGGTVSGGNATTGADGIAAPGSWTLAAAAGANTLTASSSVGTITFHATGTAGAPAQMAPVAGDVQSATAGTSVATAPSVLVVDENDNPVPGVSVTFAGGSVTGGSATTGADGVATVGSWTLGTVAGAATLTASSTGLTAVVFHATALPDAPASLTRAAGEGQTATVSTAVATAPAVLVTDQYGNPTAGVAVTFAGGNVTGSSATTGSDGVATVGSWTLETAAGANTLTATASAGSVTFHATGTAGTAVELAANDGNAQSATVDGNVATAPSVLVTDAYDNPVPGVAVSFSVTSGSGSVTGGSATTGADGVATVGSWTLGQTVGANTLTASSTGLTDVVFAATGTAGAPAALALSAGDGVSATAGAGVSPKPAVTITDSFGNAVPGVPVTFAGGTVTGANATTGADGTATVGSWTLGTAAGAYTLTATASVGSATFHATAVADAPATIARVAGEGQSATVGSDVSTAPSVRVTDQYGNPVAGAAVVFSGGTVTGAHATTAADGTASVGSWTLATAAGANTLTATTAAGSVDFHATGTADAAATIARSDGEGQSATVGTTVSTAPSVLVADQYGNPIAGVAVSFTGGTVTGGSATTGADGIAAVGSWTLATAAGANTLTAAGAVGSVTFHATGTADAAATIARAAGEAQSAVVDTSVATAPAALVSDQYGNPVAGVTVTFAVDSGGGSATSLVQSTDASGVATVGSWKLGTVSGANTLAATAGVGVVTFHASGTPGNVDHLLLSPADATITADDTQAYAVEGRDVFDNSLGDVTASSTLDVDGLPCVAAVCSPPSVGDHTVTAAMLGASGTASLHVTSGVATHVAFVSPSTGNLALGAQRTFNVAVEDAQNNVVTGDDATIVTLARSAGPGDLSGLGTVTVSNGSASAQVTAATAGQVTLEASATGLATASLTLTVDPAPVATIDSAPSNPSTSANATFDYSANDSAASFECSLDGAAYTACVGSGNGSAAFSGLAIGNHTFDVRAVSVTATGPAAHKAWMVDTSVPDAALTQPADGSYVIAPSVALAATAADTGTGVGAVDFEFSSTPGADCSTGTWTLIGTDTTSSYTATWTTPADGDYALRAVAHDGAAHSTCSLVHVTVDQTAPTATLAPPAAAVRGAITLHATAVADATSGVNSVSFERTPDGTSSWAFVGNGAAQGGGAYDAGFDTTGVADGLYDFRVTVTDVAGNVTQRVTPAVRVDNTPPASTLDPVAANIRQTVALTSSALDTGSGVATTGYEMSPHGANTWTPVAASFDTTSVADGDYDLRAVATDNVGNVGYSAVATTKVDNTPPDAALDAIARYVRGSLALGSATSDAGSGLASVTYELSAHAADTWAPVTTPLDSATQADGDYDVRVVAVDNAGNRTDSAAQLVTIDNTAPDAQLDDPAAGAIKRGTIDLVSTVSDATSGVASITYRVAPAGTPEASPCNTWGAEAPAHLDTTTLSDGLYDLRVVAVDNAGNGRCSAISTSVRIDNTAPQTTDDAPSGAQNHDVTVHLSPSDGGSGVGSTTYSLNGGPVQTGTSVVVPAAGHEGPNTIVYSSSDLAGNQEANRTAHVTIDTTAPTGGAAGAANAVRGDYTLTDSPTDTIASVEFFYRASSGDPWTSIGSDGDGSDGWHVTWHTPDVSDGSYELQMVETDDADNDTATPLAGTIVDNTAPSSAAVSVGGCGAECSGADITFTASADASESGIGAVDFQVKPATASDYTTVATQTSGFSMTWNSASVSDGPVDVRVAVTDKAGNGPTYSAPVTITVDNNAPTVALTAPAAGSADVSLGASGSADIATVTYERSPHGAATWTTIGTATSAPFTVAWPTGSLADGDYDVRVTATDGGGNTGSDVKTIAIDNTAPTGAMSQPAVSATVGGSAVALAATSTDGETGVDHVTFQYRAAGSGGSFIDLPSATWDTTSLPSGTYELRAEIVDRAGNVTHSAVRPVTVDSTPPTLSLAGLASTLTGDVTVDASIADATQATLQVQSGTGGWTTVGTATGSPLTIPFDTTTLADGQYDVRVLAQDAYGNQAIDTRTAIRIDNTAPSVASSVPDDGTTLDEGTAFTSVALVASESLSGVSNLKLDGVPVTAAPAVSGTSVTISFADPGAGSHSLTGSLVDTAGKAGAFRVNVTTVSSDPSLGGPPGVRKNAYPNLATVLTTPDGSATVEVPAGAYSVPADRADDFLVLGLAPTLASIAPMPGFVMAGSIIDVTMDWNSSGDGLHEFNLPLRINLLDATGGTAVPATFQNGAWRLIPLLDDPAVLPAGQSDGFYRDGTGVHILSRHLTMFTMVSENSLVTPAPPKDFSGVVAADGLTLRWGPGIDNDRLQNFALYVDGQSYRVFGAREFEAKLGAFTADDTRSFSLAEINTSGVTSAPTEPLQGVPSVVGRTVDDARAALAARGFTVGKVTQVFSTQPVGTVVGPTAVEVLPAGSAVDLQVAGESVPRQAQFVFRIAVQSRVRVTKRTIVAHVLGTAPAKVAATLDGAHYRRIQRWSFPAKAGATIHTLRLRERLHPGTYTLYWSGRTADGSVYRTSQKIRVIAAKAKAHTAKPAQVLAVVTSQRGALEAAADMRQATPEESFDVIARRDVAVVVVDADTYGLSFVRGLRSVFPSTSVIAISKSPSTRSQADRAGAVAVPVSASPARIDALVARLARG